MKKLPTKEDIREQLEQETRNFLKHGGAVEEVSQGISGKNPGDAPVFLNRSLFVEPKSTRTLVPDVVAAIEARRKQKTSRTPQPKASKLPTRRLKVIYDDFGEPLRQVWVED